MDHTLPLIMAGMLFVTCGAHMALIFVPVSRHWFADMALEARVKGADIALRQSYFVTASNWC